MALRFVFLLCTLAFTVQAEGEQKYSFNQPVGSHTGTAFKLEGAGRVSAIRVWELGNWIYGIQLRWGDIWGARAGISHIFNNPNNRLVMQEIELYEDEKVIQVSGKVNNQIASLIFVSSKGRLLIAGQPSGTSFNFYPEHYGAELRFLSVTFSPNGFLTSFSTHWGLLLESRKFRKGL